MEILLHRRGGASTPISCHIMTKNTFIDIQQTFLGNHFPLKQKGRKKESGIVFTHQFCKKVNENQRQLKFRRDGLSLLASQASPKLMKT